VNVIDELWSALLRRIACRDSFDASSSEAAARGV